MRLSKKYLRKKRISKKTLRKRGRRSSRRRGRNSLRRRVNKSLRGGAEYTTGKRCEDRHTPESCELCTHCNWVDDDGYFCDLKPEHEAGQCDTITTSSLRRKKGIKVVNPPSYISCDTPNNTHELLPSYTEVDPKKTDQIPYNEKIGYGCDYYNKKNNYNLCIKNKEKDYEKINMDDVVALLKDYLTTLTDIYADDDIKFLDVWHQCGNVRARSLKNDNYYINEKLYNNFLSLYNDELRLYGNIQLDRAPPAFNASHRGGAVNPPLDSSTFKQTDEGNMEYVLNKIYNIIETNKSSIDYILLSKCREKIYKIYLYSRLFEDPTNERFRIYLKYNSDGSGNLTLVKILIENIDWKKEWKQPN
jgi:hypothetical protein